MVPEALDLEEKLASLFQPDTLLSDQYYAAFLRKTPLEPERKLMLAVLEDAIACFQNFIFARDKKGKLTFRETKEWIFKEHSDRLFSFENICEVLGFDPDYIRQGLMRWKEKELAERSKAKIYRLTSEAGRKKLNLVLCNRKKEGLMKAAASVRHAA